jgi:hypothetical protein
MSKKPLTEQQQKFLELLFLSEEDGGAGGDFVKAKKLAGYHPTYSTRNLVNHLKDEITEATKNYMVQVGPQAAMKIVNIMNKPTDLGAKEALAAAKDLLDRAGVGKTENVNISSNGGGVLLLPPKKAQSDEE